MGLAKGQKSYSDNSLVELRDYERAKDYVLQFSGKFALQQYLQIMELLSLKLAVDLLAKVFREN